MPTLCLTMIVKNEAHVIERCLRSAKPFIDSWCIVDTGSTDGTQTLIKDLLKDKPGQLHERPWKNFGHNRTEAINLATSLSKTGSDPNSQIRDPRFLLFLDADEELVVPENFKWPAFTKDSYWLELGNGSNRYWREVIVNTRIPWRYEGILHEYLACDQQYSSEKIEGPLVLGHFDGGRSKGIDTAEKYKRDATVLEQALKDEPENRRYVFYLGQSYRDSNQIEKAIEAYQRRAQMGGWEEEVWCSLLEIAKLSERLSHPPATISERYLAAYNFRPTRSEPLVWLAAYHRSRREYPIAHLYGSRAIQIPRPEDFLFLDDSCYTWRAKDEYAVASYYVGQHEESKRVCEELLTSKELPETERSRIEENLRFAQKALDGGK